MLHLTVPETDDLFDESSNCFLHIKETKLTLEHSLVSISKWESHYCRPFLSEKQMTEDEMRYYVQCMTITQNVDPKVYYALTADNYNSINEYISAPNTATTINEKEQTAKSKRFVTNELIYSWMIQLNIPIEFQKWHFNRLMTLIKVCQIEQSEGTSKMSKSDAIARHMATNAKRRAALKKPH